MLELLRRVLPDEPGEPLIDEDCGEKYYHGFNGDFSQCPRYVTDGHLLLLASAIDPAMTIERDDENYARKYGTEKKIDAVWNPACVRSDVPAALLGVCNLEESANAMALLRDTQDRLMVVNAHLLSFGLKAVHADALTVSAGAIMASCLLGGQKPWFDTPLALRRSGELVGLLMPVKYGEENFSQYDLRGEPVELTDAFRAAK